MSNAQFKRDFGKLLSRVGDKQTEIIRQVALDLSDRMIEKSPVDTGRFRANWQAAVGAVNLDTSAAPDKNGDAAKARIKAAIDTFQPGHTIFITNSLPYAHRIEYDAWSKQASAGVVRVTVAEYGQYLHRAVEKLK